MQIFKTLYMEILSDLGKSCKDSIEFPHLPLVLTPRNHSVVIKTEKLPSVQVCSLHSALRSVACFVFCFFN